MYQVIVSTLMKSSEKLLCSLHYRYYIYIHILHSFSLYVSMKPVKITRGFDV